MTIKTTVQGESQEPEQQTSQTATTEQATTEPTIKELQDQFLKIQADFQNKEADYKKQIIGLDRKNSEYQNLLKQKELETLSEKDRAVKELEFAKEERLKIEKEVQELSRQRIVDKVLFDSGIPQSFSDRIKGQTEDEIKGDVKAFNDYIDSIANQRVEKTIAERLAGKAPTTGKTPEGLTERQKLIKEYEEAEKKQDARTMMLLKDKIRSLPKE